MLKHGYLASNSVYVCTEHTDQVISSYSKKLNQVFKLIQDCEDGLDINNILKTPVCHSEFERLN